MQRFKGAVPRLMRMTEITLRWFRNGNNTCQPKLITKTNKWLAHASGSRAFVPLDTLCEEFVCEEFVCEDRTRVLVPLELCGSTVDFIDDGLAKCVNRR